MYNESLSPRKDIKEPKQTKTQSEKKIMETKTSLNNFRTLKQKQLHKIKKSNSICYLNDPKEKLTSNFTKSGNFFFGFEPNIEKENTIKKYYNAYAPYQIENYQWKRINEYYSKNVDNIQTKINQSCYSAKEVLSKEEYSKYLSNQISQREFKKEKEKLKDANEFKEYVKKINDDYKNERKEKIIYRNNLKKEFIESNHYIRVAKRTREELLRMQNLKDVQKQERILQDRQRSCEKQQQYKEKQAKEYLKNELIKQINRNIDDKKKISKFL